MSSCLSVLKQVFVLSLILHFVLLLTSCILSLQRIALSLGAGNIANYEANQGRIVMLVMCGWDFVHCSLGATGTIGNRYGYLLLFATFALAKEFAYSILWILGTWVGWYLVLYDMWFVGAGYYIATRIERIQYLASNYRNECHHNALPQYARGPGSSESGASFAGPFPPSHVPITSLPLPLHHTTPIHGHLPPVATISSSPQVSARHLKMMSFNGMMTTGRETSLPVSGHHHHNNCSSAYYY